jgi:KDO2-lipid IV(A) lauroyltransferase
LDEQAEIRFYLHLMPRNTSSIASPRYWPTWLGLGLLFLMAKLLPYAAAVWLGERLGRLGYRLAKRRRHIAEVNLRLCYPDLEEPALQQRLREHFESVGIALIMTGFAWWASDEKLRSLVRIEGLEYLQESLAQGRGALLLACHFTDLEISGRLLSQSIPFGVIYRQHENPVIEWALFKNRTRNFTAAVPRDDIRQLVRTLKQNQVFWYAPDQSFRGRNSTLAPFFGVPAATNTGTSRLAKISRAPLHPFINYRLPGSQGYRLIIKPALEGFPSDDLTADAARINRVIEEEIAYAPAQYLWLHRRFKKREGLPDPY